MAFFISERRLREIIAEEMREALAPLQAAIGKLTPGEKPVLIKLNQILMNTTELKAALDAATAKVTKIETEQTARFNAQSTIIGELTAEVQRLRDLIAAGGELPAEVAASLTMLETKLAAFDDTIPDAQA